MSEFTVRPEDLAGMLEAHEANRRERLLDGLELGAERGRVKILRVTPTDQGEARRGWYVRRLVDEVTLTNDTPHAEILEAGRRPGQAFPPYAPLREWVERHAEELGVGNERTLLASKRTISPEALLREDDAPGDEYERDLDATTRDIQRAIAARGLPAHLMVGSRLDELAGYAAREVKRALQEGP